MKKWFLVLPTVVACLINAPVSAEDCYPFNCNPCNRGYNPFLFDGFYLGGNVGFASYDTNRTDRDGYLTNVNSNRQIETGWAVGLQMGYDWVCNRKLIGVVIDWDWSNVKTQVRLLPNIVNAGERSIDSRLEWFTTVRARTGFVLCDTLLYLTGGVAIANHKTRINGSIGGITSEVHNIDKHRWGWTGGFGTEFALWCNWSVNAELLYLRFDTREQSFTSELQANRTVSFYLSEDAWVGRLGFNYRFSFCNLW